MTTFYGTIIEPLIGEGVDLAEHYEIRDIYAATAPFRSDLVSGTSCPAFSAVAVTVLSPTSIRVTFPFAAKNNSALLQPGNYVITPSLAVYSVTPENVTEPTYVDLTIDEQKTGTNYQVEVQGVERV